jgi:hypothetical protein
MISDELLDRAYRDVASTPKEHNRIDMTLFNRVIAELRDRGSLDEEDIRYFPENYNITNDEMITVFNYLMKVAHVNSASPHVFNSDGFDEVIYLFQYGNLKFAIRRLDGQGTAFQMYTTEEEGRYHKIKEDKDIKF